MFFAKRRQHRTGRARRAVLAFIAALATALPAVAQAGTVAITFDDLPVFGPFPSAAAGQVLTTKLLAGIRRNRWRATGFVNELQLEAPDREARIALLRQWLDAGLDLGNHSYSHLSLNHTPVDVYIADVARGETVTKQLLAERGRRERWYRYPYLETGTTPAVRQTFEAWLANHDYRVAPVTMENSDWEFGDCYADALGHGDTAEAARIRRAYLDFTARIVPWYRMAARHLLGREPAYVFLLHASQLNADSIDQIAAVFRRNHLHPVTLDKAMRDRAYRIADTYVGPDGDEWLTRWAITLHKDLVYTGLPEVPREIAAYDALLDQEAAATAATAPTAPAVPTSAPVTPAAPPAS